MKDIGSTALSLGISANQKRKRTTTTKFSPVYTKTENKKPRNESPTYYEIIDTDDDDNRETPMEKTVITRYCFSIFFIINLFLTLL